MAKDLFGKRDFIHIPEDDEYTRPDGQRPVYRFTREEKGRVIRRYWSSHCPQRTSSTNRRVSRWEHETVIEAAEQRLDQEPEHKRVRRSTVEHPFGRLKAWIGCNYFLTRTLSRVSTEMSLHVLAYNLKRLIAIKSIKPLVAAMRALVALGVDYIGSYGPEWKLQLAREKTVIKFTR